MPTILFNNYTGRRLTLQITGHQKPIYVNKNNWVQSKEGEIVVNLQARIFWFKKAKHSFTLNIKRTDRIVSIYMDPLLKLYLYPTQQYPIRTIGFGSRTVSSDKRVPKPPARITVLMCRP